MKTTYLEFDLDTTNANEMKFQITYQSEMVDRFFDLLASLGKDGFMTKVGYKVCRSHYPEFKLSQNKIFLRGVLKSQDRKVDVTPFQKPEQYRAGAKKMFIEALKEFGDEVGKAERAGLLSGYPTYSVWNRPTVSLKTNFINPLANMNKASAFTTAGFGDVLSNIEAWLCTPSYAWNFPTPPATRKVIHISI